MGTCKDCRWWSFEWRAIGSNDANENRGTCVRLRKEESGAAVDWCGCCEAVLMTDPDFGCVQFEAKMAERPPDVAYDVAGRPYCSACGDSGSGPCAYHRRTGGGRHG